MQKATHVDIEFDLGKTFTKEQILALKKELIKAIPGLNIDFKQYPSLPGHMGDGPLLYVLYGTLVATTEVSIHLLSDVVAEAYKNWKNRHQPKHNTAENENVKALGINYTIKNDIERKDFTINNQGILEEWLFEPYCINPLTTHAVLVGCGSFINNIPPITPAGNNLKDMYDLLTDKRYFGLERDNVHLLLDKTSHQIQDTLYTISRLPGIETFLFYYVGHGFSTLDNDYILAATDTEKKGDFINSGINKKFIENQILENSSAKQKIIIVDACYSGVLTQGELPDLFNAVTGSYILTSSNSEEVSLFDKEAQNTYFTEALINILRLGIPVEKETITLDDLYIYTTEWLTRKKLPKPTYKSGLNIPPANYNISNNPGFSYEHQKSKTIQLIKQGNLDEASYSIKRLLGKYPGNEELKELVVTVDTDRMFIGLAQEGDRAFYAEDDPQKAIEKYKKALTLKNDPLIKERLNKCVASLKDSNKSDIAPSQINSQPLGGSLPQTVSAIEPVNRLNAELKKIFTGKNIVLFFSIFVAAIVGKYFFNRMTEDKAGTKQKQEKIEAVDTISPAKTVVNYNPPPVAGIEAKNKNVKEKKRDSLVTQPVNKQPKFKNWELLNGAVFEQSRSTDNMSFIDEGNNTYSLVGKTAGYNVQGKIVVLSNTNFKVVSGDISGTLSFNDNYTELRGNIIIKQSDLPYKINMLRKE